MKRAAELRLAEARDDALSTLAIQVKWNLEKVEALSKEKNGIPAGAIELRDLISVVDKFTTLAELLAGRATERTHVEIVEVQTWMHAFIVAVEPLVIPAKRPEFVRAISEAQLSNQGVIAA